MVNSGYRHRYRDLRNIPKHIPIFEIPRLSKEGNSLGLLRHTVPIFIGVILTTLALDGELSWSSPDEF